MAWPQAVIGSDRGRVVPGVFRVSQKSADGGTTGRQDYGVTGLRRTGVRG